MSAPKWAVGMQRLALGVYVQGGTLHFDTVELCGVMGVPPTKENQDAAEDAALRSLREAFGDIPVAYVDDSEPKARAQAARSPRPPAPVPQRGRTK